MQVVEKTSPHKVVVLGTGGTIAGVASSCLDNLGYTAAQVGVAQLLEGVTALPSVLAGRSLVVEQVAQVDSKDMNFSVWRDLAARVGFHLAQADVAGIVITHGTDTLEETAYFLHAVLPAARLAMKPVVLTCAMRPASSASPDGPQNLMDAVSVAVTPGACGVVVVCAGTIHGAVDVQKVYTYRLDAFDSGDAGVVGYVEEARVRLVRNWPLAPVVIGQSAMKNIANTTLWPRVEIVMNYVGAGGAIVDALVSTKPLMRLEGDLGQDGGLVRGLVVAGTGNGSIHRDLEAALIRAQAAGVSVVRATRCARGRVLAAQDSAMANSEGLSPAKARVALMLKLMA